MALFTSNCSTSTRASASSRLAALILAATASMLVGCAPLGVLGDYSRTTNVVWQTSEDIIGNIAVGDHVVVAYLRDGDGAAIGAWSLEDGRRLWHTPVSLGSNAPGYDIVAMVVSVDGVDYTAFIGPGSDQSVVVDAATGEDVAGGRMAVRHAMRPYGCEQTICLRAYRSDGGSPQTWRFDPRAGILVADADDTPDDARMLGERVFATDDRAPDGEEMLGMLDGDGNIVWTRSYTEVFGRWASSDSGWTWHDDPELDVIIGTGAGVEHQVTESLLAGGRERVDMVGARHTVALDAADGRTLWRRDGAQLCPGFLDAAPRSGVIVLCEVEGEVVQWTDPEGAYQSDWSQTMWALRGVRVESGDVVWEQEISDEAVVGEDAMIASDDALVIAATTRGVRAIDRVTGQIQKTDAAALACLVARDPLRVPFRDRIVEQATGHAAHPCVAGERTEAGFSLGAARAVGVAAGGDRYVVTTENGLVLVAAG